MFSFRFAIETIRYRSFIIEELVLSLTSLKLTAPALYTLRKSYLNLSDPGLYRAGECRVCTYKVHILYLLNPFPPTYAYTYTVA